MAFHNSTLNFISLCKICALLDTYNIEHVNWYLLCTSSAMYILRLGPLVLNKVYFLSFIKAIVGQADVLSFIGR